MLRVTRQLPRIRASSPLARGLVFAYLPGTMVNLVRPSEVAQSSGVAGRVQNSLRMCGGVNNGLTFGSGGLLGPLNNSTVVGIGTFDNGYACIYGERSAGNEIYKLETGRFFSGARVQGVQFTYRNSGGVLAFTYADTPLGAGQRMFAAIKTGTQHEVWTGLVDRPGSATEAYATASFGGDSTFSSPAVLRTHGYDAQDGDQPLSGTSDLLLGWNRSLSIAELQQLRSDPSQLIEWARLPVFNATAVVAPATLNGSAAAVVAAHGALSSATPMAGAAQAAAAGAGALSTSIPVSGAAVASATVAGSLATSIPLAGAAVVSTTVSGTFAGSSAKLRGAAAVSTSIGAALSTVISLAGTARAEPSVTGTLAGTAMVLAGSAIARVSSAGTLSTQIPLAGTAAAVAFAYGALATKISLGGTAVVSAAASGALSVGKPSAPIDISKLSPSRIVVFEGSGSRIVVFEGSGKRTRINEMTAKVPIKVGEKWMSERDPEEESYYAADITDELADRFTNVKDSADAIEIIVHGVEQIGVHSLQVAEVDGVERTYVVVFLVGIDADPPDDWHWLARVRCANGERFDKTTWFKRTDT